MNDDLLFIWNECVIEFGDLIRVKHNVYKDEYVTGIVINFLQFKELNYSLIKIQSHVDTWHIGICDYKLIKHVKGL